MSRNSLMAALAVILIAIPAAASGPVRFPLDFTSGPFPLGSCGSFDVIETKSVTGAQLVWFDANGQPVRAVTHVQARITFTNSETGQMVTGFSNVEQNVDVTTQAESQHGLAVSVDLPQRGKLYVEAGKISVNFVTGEVTFITPGFKKDILTPLCSALS